MFFISCARLTPKAPSVWAALTFWLAAFSPGPVFHISPGIVYMGWATALAETPAIKTNEAVLTLGQALELALTGNPGLAEIRARAEAIAAVPSQEGALPDPTLRFGALYLPTDSFSLQQDDFTMMEAGVSQEIPFPGKLALREKIAEQEALAAADSVDEARLRLAGGVKRGWWQLFYYDRALNLLDESEHFFQQLIAIAQAKYQVGEGSQQDVLLAQLELSRLKEEKLDLVSMRAAQNARFNAMLDRAAETPVRIPAEAEFRLPVLVESALHDKALQIRPLFAQHRKMLDAGLARVDLAQQGFYPDFTVGAFYDARRNTPTGQPRTDFASVQLSINLPIYAGRKQARAIDQRQSELLQAQYALEDDHRKIQAEIAAKAAEYQQTKEKLLLLEHEIIPQAEQTVRSLLAGYQVSQASFSDLLRTQLSLFQYQTRYWQALAGTQQLLADLSAEVGEELGHD
ncbi:Outer membrane heavy metal efflux protein [Candidatus Methylobacter favarea]|uniref:Outer membrane heavy metal efflux protein n=1 Tax=Candidatus Methylobacter favarea TaxID=2707345 RepID=A0A8S0XEK6_9GAMM|nr:TolC family protein [Candidatus Methylobacter favarea]CAA9889822.1 Outer membrane heavy metal efflux protein [Candidatus Methylobacter favarea]